MNNHQQALIDGLLHHDDLRERLSAVVDRTRLNPPLSPADRSDRQRVAGCISPVWLVSTVVDERCLFRSHAESPVVRGLVALIADFFSGLTPAEIISGKDDPLDLLELKQSLSPTRRHGLAAVTTSIRAFANAQLTAEGPQAHRNGPSSGR